MMKINMLKLAMSTALLFSLCLCSFAQRFDIESDGLLDLTYAVNDYASNNLNIYNLTTGPEEALALRWVLIENTFISGWDYSLCDYGSCFPVIPDSNDMSVTDVGGNAFLTCHALFNGIPGTGTMSFSVFETEDPSNADTVTFVYTAGTVGINESNEMSLVSIYPNPVSNNELHVLRGENSILKIYNEVGQVELRRNIRNMNATVNLEHLPSGIYIVEIANNNGMEIKKLVIE